MSDGQRQDPVGWAGIIQATMPLSAPSSPSSLNPLGSPVPAQDPLGQDGPTSKQPIASVSDQSGSAVNGVDATSSGGSSTATVSSGYVDVNGSVQVAILYGLPVGVTFGLAMDRATGNVYFCFGGGFVAGASGAVTGSADSLTRGVNAGAQVTAFGQSGQVGYSFGGKEYGPPSSFFEYGGGAPSGAAITIYYVPPTPVFTLPLAPVCAP